MRESLLRMLILCRKELLAVLKDPRGRSALFAPVIVQALLFGYAATFDLSKVAYAVLDQDRSGTSRALIAQIEGGGIFERVADLHSVAEIARVIDPKRALLVLHIGQDFERRLAAGQTVAVQVIADGRNSNTAATATGYVSAIVESFNARWRTEHGGSASPTIVEVRSWYNENLETRWGMIPSLMAALSLLQTLLLSALSVAREREQGTFDQLLVTPLRAGEIMVGKAVPSILVGMTQSTLMLFIALWWFGIPFAGAVVTLYVALLLFTIAAVSIGLVISAFSANMQQAMQYTFMAMSPMMLLSGLMSPIENMPAALQVATIANPLRSGIEGVRRVYLEGAGFALIANDLLLLALIAMVMLPIAAWLFRHRLV